VSSAEDEFRSLRANLKDTIDKVQIVNYKRVVDIGERETSVPRQYTQFLFKAEVVEYSRDGNIDQKVLRAMNRSQFYVGIFGNDYSSRTVEEFKDALKRGMSPLVYYYTEPPSVLKQNKGSTAKPNEVYDFLINYVYPIAIINGNYSRINFKTQADLEDEIIADLSAEVIESIWRHHNVQKAVKGYTT
jgi:hypothetical protein